MHCSGHVSLHSSHTDQDPTTHRYMTNRLLTHAHTHKRSHSSTLVQPFIIQLHTTHTYRTHLKSNMHHTFETGPTVLWRKENVYLKIRCIFIHSLQYPLFHWEGWRGRSQRRTWNTSRSTAISWSSAGSTPRRTKQGRRRSGSPCPWTTSWPISV